ncbi:gem-associated protein 6 [Nephila pilipes]|uniref:Gem-associated protein 6 n=1 Tax=Nephila pilipes TaxID=299642 RepID=A0A8X6TZW8_NEPPI|nr:gem-associated protein 6 [Nephila pilipes]
MNIDFANTLKYKDHLMKYVEIKITGSKTLQGWLQCVDPITGNLILARASDKKLNEDIIVFVTAASIKRLEVLRDSGEDMKDILPNFTNEEQNVFSEDNLERKKRLILWLKKNRLPFKDTDDGDGLVICDSVTIRPPYEAENCVSMNGRVLMMVQKLVSNLPEEMEEVVNVKAEK